jgi:hypothetical protein
MVELAIPSNLPWVLTAQKIKNYVKIKQGLGFFK